MTAGLRSSSGGRAEGRHGDPAAAGRAAAGCDASVRVEPCIFMRGPQHRHPSRNARFCGMLHILSTSCITILMTSPRNVGVLGASGYAGAELLRLLARHPDLDVAWAAGDQAAGQPLAARYPGLQAAYGQLAFCSVQEGLDKGADVLFCALPHGRAAEIAPLALAAAGLVVDLSADFRLRDPAAYPAWYGAGWPCPAATRPRPCSPWPRWSRPGWSPPTASWSTPSRGCRGPAARWPTPTCSSRRTRTWPPTRWGATATPRRSSRSWPWPPAPR